MNTDTQPSIDTRIIAAAARVKVAEEAYHAKNGTLADYVTAQEELRALKAEPMLSLAPVMLPKRYQDLEA